MDEIVKEIEVVKSFSDDDWYSKCIGQKFAVMDPTWWSLAEGDCYYVEHPENDEDTVFYVLKNDCKVTKSVARSAPETTASPSETAAVEGILTEEELKERNRLLVLENDELLAEVEKIKQLIFKLDAHIDFSFPPAQGELMEFKDVGGITLVFKEVYRLVNPEQAAQNEALEELK